MLGTLVALVGLYEDGYPNMLRLMWIHEVLVV